MQATKSRKTKSQEQVKGRAFATEVDGIALTYSESVNAVRNDIQRGW